MPHHARIGIHLCDFESQAAVSETVPHQCVCGSAITLATLRARR